MIEKTTNLGKPRRSREEILDLFRACLAKVGRTPGEGVFCKLTRISQADIRYYWPRYSALVEEVGAQPNEFQSKKIALYDPNNSTVRAELTSLGVPFILLDSADLLNLRHFDLLIVGPGALSDKWPPFLENLPDHVRKGLHVLVLEQGKLPEQLGVEIALVDYIDMPDARDLSVLFPAEFKQPLRQWGREMFAFQGGLLDIPKERRSVILWSATNYPTLQNKDTPDFALSAIVPEGSGIYLLNQIDISTHFGDEPLARWWLVQLIRKSLQQRIPDGSKSNQ